MHAKQDFFRNRARRSKRTIAKITEKKGKSRIQSTGHWICDTDLAQIAKVVVLGDPLGHLFSSVDVCGPLVGIRACWTAESQQGHDRQSENPPRAHDSTSAAPTIATGCSSFAASAGRRYHPALYIYPPPTPPPPSPPLPRLTEVAATQR